MKWIKSLVSWILVFVLIVPTLAGCGGGGETAGTSITQPAEKIISFLVETDSRNEIVTYRHEDGSIFDDEELKQIAENLAKDHTSIGFLLKDPDQDNGSSEKWGVQIGKYYVRLSWENHNLDTSCFHTNNYWHINLEIKINQPKPEIKLINFHIGGYRDNNGIFRIGIYSSPPHLYCATSEGAFTRFKEFLERTIQRCAPSIPYWAVAAMAYTAAIILIPALLTVAAAQEPTPNPNPSPIPSPNPDPINGGGGNNSNPINWQNATNLYDYYHAWDKSLPAFVIRAQFYEILGFGPASSYIGTAAQNTRLLNTLKDRGISPTTVEELKPQNIPPNPPGLITPTDGELFPRNQAEILFRWEFGADPDNGPNSPDFAIYIYNQNCECVLDRGFFPENYFRWTLPPGNFTWKIAQRDGETDTKSGLRSFRISEKTIPHSPTLLYPTNNQHITSQRTYFTWDDNGNDSQQTMYVIYIYDIANNCVFDSNWSICSNNDGLGPRLPTGQYSYIIKAKNEDFESSPSPRYSFYFTQEPLPLNIDLDPTHYKAVWVDQSPYFTGYPGEVYPIWTKIKNIGEATWRRDPCYEARWAVNKLNPANELFWMKWRGPSWISNNRLAVFSEPGVKPGEIATFASDVRIPCGLGPGYEQFKTALVFDAITWPDGNVRDIWWGVTLPKPTADCITQSAYPTACPGDNVNMSVTFRNTTGYYWRKNSPAPTNLALDKYADEAFLKRFRHSSWLSDNRIASLPSEFVHNGELATYNFTIHIPDDLAPRKYRFYIRLVQDGYSWFDNPSNNGAAWWDITVINR